MEPFVSVIVPVFRVEQYLEECVDSLLDQSLNNIEVILIDDGSDDNCPALCDKYQMLYSHVKVIHQKNKGVSAARNVGLLVAKGKYIAFCDPDDTMKPNMLEVLYQCAEEQNIDIVICGFETVPDGQTNIRGGVHTKSENVARRIDLFKPQNTCKKRFMFFVEFFNKEKLDNRKTNCI